MTAIDARPWMFVETRSSAGVVDGVLIFVYLVGIYLGLSLNLPGGVPLPSAIAGMAGLLLALKHAPHMPTTHAVAGIAVLIVAALSILSAENYGLLGERFKGFVQFSYSLVISYGVFLAARRFERVTLARLFLALALAILAGALLETTVPAFKQLSDNVRALVYETGLYGSDVRDVALYGIVRPKLFTSEPSFIAFGYTLFAFCWYVLSRAPGKALAYLALLAAGYYLMRGPTVVLGVILVPVYEVLLGARRTRNGRRRLDGSYALIAAFLAGFVALLGIAIGWEVLGQRLDNILAGRDPSFFARIIAPAIIAFQTIGQHPIAGVGLTGWEALEDQVAQLYATSSYLAVDLRFDGASHSLTNYFWALWTFLGLVWGTALVLALSWLLRRIGVPSLLFCWAVWIVFGQAAGGFVGPRAWAVLFLAAAISVLHEYGPVRHAAGRGTWRSAWPRFPDLWPAAPHERPLHERREPHLGPGPQTRKEPYSGPR